VEFTIDGRLCASCKPPSLPNRQPGRCGPCRNSPPPRATATATSHSERTLCSDSIVLTVHPSASVPPHITRQCVPLPIGRPASLLTTHTGAAAWYFPFLEPAQSPPSTGLAQRAPCTVLIEEPSKKMGRAPRFVLKFGLHFLFQDPRIRRSPSDREKSLIGSNCLCTSTSGDFVRWESSNEGSNRRCKSLAAKALSAAANSIKTLITISIRFTL